MLRKSQYFFTQKSKLKNRAKKETEQRFIRPISRLQSAKKTFQLSEQATEIVKQIRILQSWEWLKIHILVMRC